MERSAAKWRRRWPKASASAASRATEAESPESQVRAAAPSRSPWAWGISRSREKKARRWANSISPGTASHAGPQLAELAESIDIAAAELGVPREDRPYSPHLTLARARAGRTSGSPKWRKGDGPNTTFAVLEKRLAAMGKLDFGKMTAHEFILYQSQLSPKGSKYTKLQRFPLRRS